MADYPDPYSSIPEFSLKKISLPELPDLNSRNYNAQTQWIVPVDEQPPALEQMQRDNEQTLLYQEEALAQPEVNPLDIINLNAPLGLPSIDPGSFQDIAGFATQGISVGGGLFGIVRGITNIACNFKLPVVNIPLLGFLQTINIPGLIDKLKSGQYKFPVSFNTDSIRSSLKRLLPDYKTIFNNFFKQLFTCDNHRD
jgi:hypothetical protein